MKTNIVLPKPDCKLGYTQSQIEQIVGTALMPKFNEFMRGQTLGICEGKQYDPEINGYRLSNCGPHGIVTYPCDVQNFFANGKFGRS